MAGHHWGPLGRKFAVKNNYDFLVCYRFFEEFPFQLLKIIYVDGSFNMTSRVLKWVARINDIVFIANAGELAINQIDHGCRCDSFNGIGSPKKAGQLGPLARYFVYTWLAPKAR